MISALGRKCLGFGYSPPAASAPDITNGITAAIEQFLVDTLKVLKYDGKTVFKTVDRWRWQIGANEGGLETFDALAPFAFAAYEPPSGQCQGGDLQQILKFSITFGTASKQAGICRCGDANHLGTSKIRDLIIAALDKSHPGSSIACDPIYYQDEAELVDSANRHAIDMFFTTNFIT